MLLGSCAQPVKPVNPIEKFLGTYDMHCLCNDTGTPQDDSIASNFAMQIIEISGDTNHMVLSNVHNLGVNDTVDYIGYNSFNNDFNYSTGTLVHPDTVALTYMRTNLFCQGRGARQ